MPFRIKRLLGLLFGLLASMVFFLFYNSRLMDKTIVVEDSSSILRVNPNLQTPPRSNNCLKNQSNKSKKLLKASKSIRMDQHEFARTMEALQEERRAMVKRICERIHPKKMQNSVSDSKSVLNEFSFTNNAFYSNTYKYAVCYIQKCGYSNWLRAVLVHDGFYTLQEYAKFTSDGQKLMDFIMENRAISAITNKSLKAKIWNQSLKIIRVRNPFERIVSAYIDKMTEELSPFTYVYGPMSKQINKNYKPLRHNLEDRLKNDTTASFEDFVRHLLSDAPRDSHWQFYDTFCRPCYADYDYVIKFETIVQDLAYLKLKLNITDEDHQKVFSAVIPNTKQDTTRKYFDQIPKDLAERLYEKYENDFLLFGYEKPSWLCSEINLR